MAWRLWQDLTTAAFDALDRDATIVVLPISAVEQHGPHLPVGTDAMIAAGMLATASDMMPDKPDILVLPQLAVGASLEHCGFSGTLSVPSAALADQIVALAGQIHAAGLRKLVIVSSHGGNVAAMTDAALRCRAEMGMLAVNLTWARLGVPEAIVTADERAFGVHGGCVETSLMLHFRPDLVAMGQARKFNSLQQTLAGDFDLLRAHGPVGFGWMAQDLNPAGVVGDAAAATAGAGSAIAEHQARRFVTLLREVGRFELSKPLK
jgi:creatinine amidohydrolase